MDHEVDGVLVTTIVGNDGVRWACRVCDGTMFQNAEGEWRHFGPREPEPADD